MSKRILFLYISPSSGHQHAAEAIQEALRLIAPDWESQGLDSFTYVYPTIGKWIAKTYLEVLRRTPMLWDFLYDNPDIVSATREVRELLNIVSSPKLNRLVKRYNPQAIVCTQAVPCSVFAAEKRRGKLKVPLIAVITDFAIHSYWIYPEVDLYCAPSEEVRRTLIKQGIPHHKIVVTGIPISPRYMQTTPRPLAKQRLGFDRQKPAVLVMGGSQGLGPLDLLVQKLTSISYLQCIVTTGLNRELFRMLQKKYRTDRSVAIVGYTKLVHELMDAADLLITKPGGLTSSEALAKGLPMIITNPLPGQEERNSHYLLKQGTAERADTIESVILGVHNVLQHPHKLKRMQEHALAIAKPYAAIEIARAIFQVLAVT